MGLFKSLGRIVKKATKPVKKVLKSDLGKLALMYGAYRYGPGLLDKKATGWGNVNWKGIPAWKIGAASGVLSLAGSMDEEEDKITDVADTAGHDAYLKYRKYFPFGEEEPIFTSAQGGRVPANIGLYAGPQAAMNQNMNPNMNQGVGSMNPLGLGAPTSMNAGRPSMDPRVAQERSTPTMPAQLSKPPQENADAELIQLIKMLTAMGFPMEQLRGRTKDELVEMLVAVSGKGGEEVEEAEVVEASTGGRIGYDIGGSPHSEVVEKQEDIEMAGTDTPILELEDLPKLLEDFYEIFGRSPTSIDELKSWAANRTTEAPEEVVEEQVVEANTGGLMRTGYALGSEHPIIPSKDGQQLDMRETGGYQPHGKQEKHDDVRALLAQGEFVMTSDAVKGMGGGDREVGAQKMYNLMHNMEAMA